MEDVGIFYGHFGLGILLLFDIFYGHLVYFVL
jgi:hypothetical protein